MYNFADLRLLSTTETASNPSGLLALSPSADATVLACPGLHPGQVRVELYDTRRTKFVQAHNSGLAALALSTSGKLLATASEKGTLVRVFSTADGARLRELRRGSDPARIYSLAFSRGDRPDWVAVTSDKGTAHVFSLRAPPPDDAGACRADGRPAFSPALHLVLTADISLQPSDWEAFQRPIHVVTGRTVVLIPAGDTPAVVDWGGAVALLFLDSNSTLGFQLMRSQGARGVRGAGPHRAPLAPLPPARPPPPHSHPAQARRRPRLGCCRPMQRCGAAPSGLLWSRPTAAAWCF